MLVLSNTGRIERCDKRVAALLQTQTKLSFVCEAFFQIRVNMLKVPIYVDTNNILNCRQIWSKLFRCYRQYLPASCKQG